MTPRKLGRILLITFAVGVVLAGTLSVAQFVLHRAEGVVAMQDTLRDLGTTLLPLRLGIYGAIAWVVPAYLFRISGMDPTAPERARDLWVMRAALAVFTVFMEFMLQARFL